MRAHLLGLLVLLAPELPAGANEQPSTDFAHAILASIQSSRLSSGLRVVTSVEHRAPTIAVCATYDVSQPELVAGAGLQSTVRGRGGKLNFERGFDRTVLCVTVPSHELEFAVWASTALLRPLSPAEPPDRPLTEWDRLEAMVLGNRAGPTERSCCRADRVVLSAAGNLDLDQLMELVSGKFVPDRPSAPAPRRSSAPVPARTDARSLTLARPDLVLPEAYLGWRAPPLDSADYPTLELVAVLLEATVQEELGRRGLGVAAEVRLTRARGPNVLGLRLQLLPSVSLERAEHSVAAVLTRLTTRGPTSSEWAGARALAWRRQLHRWERLPERAEWLGALELERGDPRAISAELLDHERVDPTRATRAAARWLDFASRASLYLDPSAASVP